MPAEDPTKSAPLEYFGAKCFFASYDARPDEPLSLDLAKVWIAGFVDLAARKLDPQALARRVAPLEKTSAGETITVVELMQLLPAQRAATSKYLSFHSTETPLTRAGACRVLYELVKKGPLP